MLLPTEHAKRTRGVVRALGVDDIPALVALRRRAFTQSERATPERSAAFFREVFFENPWRDAELPSLIYENANGEVAGFLGSLPRTMVSGGRVIRIAIGTQLMVAPEDPGLAGRRLLRAFMDGPQDLSLGDTANDAARRLWASIGGHSSALLSLSWVRRLRPWRQRMRELGRGPAAMGLQLATAPACALLDRLAVRRLLRFAPDARAYPLTAADICEIQDDVLSGFTLRPRYDVPSLAWLLSRAGEKRQFGPLHSARVVDRYGEPLGWYMYHLGKDGTAHVLQIAARRRREAHVLQRLYRDAWDRGAVTVSGRAEAWLMRTLLDDDSVFVYQGPWTLLHARKPALSEQLERDTSYFSRLDGEWWLSF
ncbi:MAG TPA: hypothetical protein VF483_05250 [Gemmatimonadaceae bacterium]